MNIVIAPSVFVGGEGETRINGDQTFFVMT